MNEDVTNIVFEIYCGEKKNKLQVHPYKPGFWFHTNQGITRINCIVVGLNVYILFIFKPFGPREMLILTI